MARALVLAAAVALCAPAARASDPVDVATAILAVRVNPLGLLVGAGATRRWERPDGTSALERGRRLELGATVGVSPATANAELAVDWVPLAPLQLRAGYQAIWFAGRFGALLRFEGPDAPFGDSVLDARRGEERTGLGHRAFVAPVLRFQAGRWIARNETSLAVHRMSSAPGWYYETENDTLLAEGDWLVVDRATVLVEAWRGPGGPALLAGPVYEITRAGAARLVRQRAAGMILWSPAATWLGVRPRLLAMAGVNLEDRNRDGQAFAVAALLGELGL